MATKPLNAALEALLHGRRIATLGTQGPGESVHLTAVWYLFDGGHLFVATSAKSRKARNVAERPKASLMVDVRKPGTERGVTAAGRAELISGEASQEINQRIHRRYLSAEAMADPHVGPVFAAFDDVTVRITPESWFSWDMAELDAQVLGGRMGTPGYLLALD
jgi:PPOX class probable F420-dependent enzyme